MSVRVRGEIIKVNKDWSLTLEQNHIASIAEIKGLDKLASLKALFLEHNEIAKIEGLDALVNLEQLEIEGNQITKIEGLDKLSRLQDLNLSYNQITRIEGLDKLPNLKKLHLSGNQIMKPEGLETLANLQVLELDHNHITKLTGLETLAKLRVLELEDNEIMKLEGLDKLANLREITLNDNPITWPASLSETSLAAEVIAYCQGNFQPQGRLPRPTGLGIRDKNIPITDETILLRKFKDILVVSQEVRKAEVAEFLGLTEKELFAKLVGWGALNLGFKVRGDIIVVDDLNAFVKSLDQQFKQWEEGRGSKGSKV